MSRMKSTPPSNKGKKMTQYLRGEIEIDPARKRSWSIPENKILFPICDTCGTRHYRKAGKPCEFYQYPDKAEFQNSQDNKEERKNDK